MSNETATIISEDGYADNRQEPDNFDGNPFSKKLLFFIIGLVLLIALIMIFIFRFYLAKDRGPVVIEGPQQEKVESVRPVLPFFDKEELAEITDISTSTDLMIEYLSFSDFYEKSEVKVEAKFENYSLPLNTKIEVINYYDISRKINLDPVIDDINEQGFALINNPWASDSFDFYSIYRKLKEKQIPTFISSDFLLYYQQNIMKKAFKDIEENIFYDNLWDISKELYLRAKTRYESRLASIGNINDPLLEGARLETIFFAVSLELLKPLTTQVAPVGVQVSQDKFSVAEANNFFFAAPLNLKDDIESELKLIREAELVTKSPILLYSRDYKDFAVPQEYRGQAKLNNFFLASKWLNSVFPLHYQGNDCPKCLLDREDWRINFIASLLISDDFSSLPQIKNRWARIYKVISFFAGLRDDLDYINYRDSLISIFSQDYEIESIFQGSNEEIDQKLKQVALEIEKIKFLEIQGGPSTKDLENKTGIGLKVLTDYFSPDNYLLSKLVSPNVGNYLGKGLENNNTACGSSQSIKRCNGSAYDIINLVQPLDNYNYFLENSNYTNYQKEASKLRNEIKIGIKNRTTNYWSFLSLVQDFLNFDKKLMPIFSQTPKWEEKYFNVMAASWGNYHLPFEKFNVNQSIGPKGLDDFSRWSESSYIEPNLALLNELISVNKMVLSMFSALRIEVEAKQVVKEISAATDNLEKVRAIIIKEIAGEKLSDTDFEFISDFSSLLEILEPIKNKSFSLNPNSFSQALKGDLSNLKLMVVVNQKEGEKSFSLGPVWNYKEGK